MLNYSVVPRQNPITKTKKFYAQLASPVPITISQLAKRISNACTVTPADVEAVLVALETQVVYALQEGKSVRLGKIGSFRTTMHTSGVDNPQLFSTANIKRLSVRFTPASELRKGLQPGNPEVKFKMTKDATPPAGSGGSDLGPEGGLENA